MTNEVASAEQLPPVDEIRVNKWDGAAVKHAIDDAVKKLLISRPNHTENFGLVDKRLFICGLAVAIALFALAWDFKHPFPASRPVLIGCVLAYFALMGLLTLYTTFCERGIFAVATQRQPDGELIKWEASSGMQKFDDQYTLYVACRDRNAQREAHLVRSCAFYVHENGVVNETAVGNDLNKLINILKDKKTQKKAQ